jgi:hypothetical protein
MQHGMNVFPVGSRVRIMSYGPFRGLRGTIRSVHTIFSPDPQEPFCFYLVALEEAQWKEPVWFEYDEVELISAPFVALAASEYSLA